MFFFGGVITPTPPWHAAFTLNTHRKKDPRFFSSLHFALIFVTSWGRSLLPVCLYCFHFSFFPPFFLKDRFPHLHIPLRRNIIGICSGMWFLDCKKNKINKKAQLVWWTSSHWRIKLCLYPLLFLFVCFVCFFTCIVAFRALNVTTGDNGRLFCRESLCSYY